MTNVFEFVKSLFTSSRDQGWLFDSTVYCRIGGLDPQKILANNFAGILIQSGRGTEIVDTLQDQIDVAEICNLPYGIWHIPDPLDGPMSVQANLVMDQPRVKGHLFFGDFERRYTNNPASMASPSQGLDFLNAIDDINGRASWGYSNPNNLKNVWKMPDWVYDRDWWIAEYPSSSWEYYEDFLQYYAWKTPRHFSDDAEFTKRIKIWQWTMYGKAQYYYASTTLPSGGSGIKGGDLDIAMMTKEEVQELLKPSNEPEIPDPSCDCDALEKRLEAVEMAQEGILATITDLVEYDDEVHDKIVEFEQRIEDLEDRVWQLENKPVEPGPEDEVLLCKVKPDANCPVYLPVSHDKACVGQTPPGKPVFEQKIGVLPKGSTFEIMAHFKYSCKDNPDNPWVIQSGGAEFGVIIDGDFGPVGFVPRKRFDLI